MEEKPELELSFPEMMLSDIATDVAMVRRNTTFLAGVVLGYVVIAAVVFLLATVT